MFLLLCGCLRSVSSHKVLGWSVIVAFPGHTLQWHSQNAEKVTHIKGGQLYQTLIIYNYVPFQIGTSLKEKNSLPEVANSFL